MKLIALIQTSNDTLVVAATRCPDLLRRELSKEFGGAKLLWCGLPPVGENSRKVAEKLRIATHKGGISGFWAANRKIYLWIPFLGKLKIRVRRGFRALRLS